MRHRPDPSFIPTPTYLIRAGLTLTTWCPKCLTHGRTFTGEYLAEKYGAGTNLHELSKRMRCAKAGCGHRGSETQFVPKIQPFTKGWEDERGG